jgi:hypothetical protein
MNAQWRESDIYYYYGEVSKTDPTKLHGKGI